MGAFDLVVWRVTFNAYYATSKGPNDPSWSGVLPACATKTHLIRV